MSNIGVAYKRVNDLTELSAIPADEDFFIVVDISDANREKKILASRVISNTGINLADTTTSTTGVITKASTRFIHNFHHPTGSSAIPDAENTFVGLSSGNFTMGSTATQTWHGSLNTAIGFNTLNALTTGYDNTAVGSETLPALTTGAENTAVGTWAMILSTTGNNNTAIGAGSMSGVDITGNKNTAVGYTAGRNIGAGSNNTAIGYQTLLIGSGDSNTALGTRALLSLTTGSDNVAIGHAAGRFITGGVTANETSLNSIYIGKDIRALADGGDNEIIIGDSLTGLGSNTVVIGNDSITKTTLKGDVTITALNLVSYENETVYFEGNAVFN